MKARPPLPPEIKHLIGLIREGKLFEVQDWLKSGNSPVPPKPYRSSPARVAVETGFHSMVQVILEAGIEQEERDYLLNRAVWDNKLELAKLLVKFGADVKQVDMVDVFGTGNPEMMRFFLDAGADAVTGQPFAKALRYPKRPQLGIYMQYRDRIPNLRDQVNLALRYHAQEGGLKWVCLLLWAGGDPHVRLPDIGEPSDPENDTTALEEAVRWGNTPIIEKIGLKNEKADRARLLEYACSRANWSVIEKLLDLGADPNPQSDYGPMERMISHLAFKIDSIHGFVLDTTINAAFDPILKFADRGGRVSDSEYGLSRLRRGMYSLEPRCIEKIIVGFRDHSVLRPDRLLKFVSTAKFKEKLGDRYPKIVQSVKARS